MKASLIIDSGFLYAVLDSKDTRHRKVTAALASQRKKDIVIINPVIVETAYLLGKRIGHHAMRGFLKRIASGPFHFVCVEKNDINRIYEILESYADAQLDFTDAAITAIAERLDIGKVLTVDQKDFRMIRPKHREYFEILPS